MKTFNKIISILFCVVILDTTSAQTTDRLKPQNSIGFKIGYDRSYLRDINFSPLIYKGNGVVFDLKYRRQTKRNNILLLRFDHTYNILESDASTYFSSERLLTNFEIGYLKQTDIINDNQHLKFHIEIGRAHV